MRHQKTKITLDRKKASRNALLRSLSESVIIRESVKTTHAKAKAVRPLVEKLITLGKKGDLNAKRDILKVFYTKIAMKKLVDVIAPRYTDRAGGYTRIIALPPRKGDGAKMAVIELV